MWLSAEFVQSSGNGDTGRGALVTFGNDAFYPAQPICVACAVRQPRVFSDEGKGGLIVVRRRVHVLECQQPPSLPLRFRVAAPVTPSCQMVLATESRNRARMLREQIDLERMPCESS